MTVQMFRCGCRLDGYRCFDHLDAPCHIEGLPKPDRECPLCFLARLRSIQLGAGTTPTRGNR